jgi:hypothetical protein
MNTIQKAIKFYQEIENDKQAIQLKIALKKYLVSNRVNLSTLEVVPKTVFVPKESTPELLTIEEPKPIEENNAVLMANNSEASKDKARKRRIRKPKTNKDADSNN